MNSERSEYMNILTLDQSTSNCGHAIFYDRELKKHGLISPNAKEKNIINKIEEVYDELEKIIISHNIKGLIFEDTFNKRNVDVTKRLCWLQGSIMALSFKYDLGFVIYYPSEWRAILGFKQKSKTKNPQPDFKNNREYQKFQAIEYVNNKYGFNLKYGETGADDIAEAIAIGEAYFKESNKKQL